MSDTFYECPRCGKVSPRETTYCEGCSYSKNALPLVPETHSSMLALPLVFIGIGCGGLLAAFWGANRDFRSPGDYLLSEIESGKIQINSD